MRASNISPRQRQVKSGDVMCDVDSNHFLLVADFSGNKIEMFDGNFKRVRLSREAFDDDRISLEFAPYNVQAVGANVVVTYTKQNSAKTGADDNCGDNCGFVDIFTAKGKLPPRLENGLWLRAPWGVALAPQDFGCFSHDR
jgi:uncharacterized protein (TIGR03118 family)